eukprot:496914-Pleurochrysis_carterae.AAC.1
MAMRRLKTLQCACCSQDLFQLKALAAWGAKNHELAGNDAPFAGEIIIEEECLNTKQNLYALYKKRRAKPYLTASEQ